MISLRAFRSHPHFADLFAHVHVVCWPILWWQLNMLFRWCRRHDIPDVLYSVNDWGFITLRHYGEEPDPAIYTPIARTFRPLTDASWGSDIPACLLDDLAAWHTLILPREAGGGGSRQRRESEGALPSPFPNTS